MNLKKSKSIIQSYILIYNYLDGIFIIPCESGIKIFNFFYFKKIVFIKLSVFNFLINYNFDIFLKNKIIKVTWKQLTSICNLYFFD